MAPRTYNMTKREAAKAETRRRIVEATAKLHGEKGVFGTGWREIADEADVSVATVYAHFPSLDELLPACGELVMQRVRPPRAESAAEIIGDATELRERLERVARELFAFYERGGPHIEVDIRERELPGVREWEESQRATVTALVREALAGEHVDAPKLALLSAFFDLQTFKALRARGVGQSEAAETVAEIVDRLFDSGGRRRMPEGGTDD
ncbi:MAG: TetR/AcrR family transcriptional regulator [Actinomycetota bacterium]|nr:TetR/AcrR family transcriptional regulator [Actinomycetota bacterium]